MSDIITSGIYKFKIIYVDTAYISKKGNTSIRLILEIKDTTGQTYKVYEYLTKSNDPKTNLPYAFVIKKTHELLDSIGKPQLKDTDLTNDDLLGMEGYAAIRTEESAAYPPSLKVARFVIPSEQTTAQSVQTASVPEQTKTLSLEELLPSIPKEPASSNLVSRSSAAFDDDDIPF